MARLHTFPVLVLASILVLAGSFAAAQDSLPSQRWFLTVADNFTFVSQASSRQTRQLADRMESWRQIASQLIAKQANLPQANVSNYVFVFDNEEDFRHFTLGEELAFFHPTPRANFMGFMLGNDQSLREGLHHYTHFLVRNYSDLRLPRWYEEGLAGYLARIDIRRGRGEFERAGRRAYEAMLSLSESLPMVRLLYQDAALASPRIIQIANLKSETLLHYLRHGHEEGFPDRRPQLQRYLDLLLEGRNQRYAFDQAFDVTTEQLDNEYHRYLQESDLPPGQIEHAELQPHKDFDAAQLATEQAAIMLGELALNSGRPENAQLYFEMAMNADDSLARAYSGFGDALRFQDVKGRDQEIAALFERALELAPTDPEILLDYGEYWEAELGYCEKNYPASERQSIITDIKEKFRQALDLVPNSAEANLAMGQVYLFPEEDFATGLPFQQRAYELLPADSFIMEQSAKYAIAAERFEEAERLIDELAQPLHFFGVPEFVNNLRQRLQAQRQGEVYEVCAGF